MTGVQALERAAPDLPMRSGEVARHQFESIRHGTQSVIAAVDVATPAEGHGIVGDTRTEQDYASFLEALFATAAPTTGWQVICDNLNTHLSESVVRLVARLCGIEDELGEKGKGMSAPRSSHLTRTGSRRCRRSTLRPNPTRC